jgi:hypothetical protein
MEHSLPEVIKNQLNCQQFSTWLHEHSEVHGVQGYRNENGVLVSISTNARLSNVAAMWTERAGLNDWIRTYRKTAR